MSFMKLEGHTVLFKATAISAAQMQLVKEIIAHYEGRTLLTRKECRDAHGVLRGKRAAPYFISKNMACKTKQHGMYELKGLKISAAAQKALDAPPAATSEETPSKPAAKKKAAKKSPAKKGAAPKKEAAKKPKGKKAKDAVTEPSEALPEVTEGAPAAE